MYWPAQYTVLTVIHPLFHFLCQFSKICAFLFLMFLFEDIQLFLTNRLLQLDPALLVAVTISHALPRFTWTTFPIIHLPGLITQNTIHLHCTD